MLSCLLPLTLTQWSIAWRPELPAPAPRGALVLPSGVILMPGRTDGPGARLGCFTSEDEGKTWTRRGIIATDPNPKTDLGDGNLVQTHDGQLLAIFRHNHHLPSNDKPDYAIEVSASQDGGKTWQPPTTVATSRPESKTPSRGLWSPLLFVTQEGDIQAYYDDEDTPFQKGFPSHQWLTMRTYSPKDKQWEKPVTVARAHDPSLLSRDGMASVVELKSGQLLCAFESVQTNAPHAGLIRMVESTDGGRTWSWSSRERDVLYQPHDPRYHAFAPSLVKLNDGSLLTFFATNEDRGEPGISGTPPRNFTLDIKWVSSADAGHTWDRTANLLYGGTHHNYLPGVTLLPGKETRLFATFLDFKLGPLSKIGLGKKLP